MFSINNNLFLKTLLVVTKQTQLFVKKRIYLVFKVSTREVIIQ